MRTFQHVLLPLVVSYVVVAYRFSRSPLQTRRILASLNSQQQSEYDVVVIGAGLAGLCCAATLASEGVKVCVCESHYEIGGCAHEFMFTEDGRTIPSDLLDESNVDKVYKFEAGPSLYSGLSSDRSPNPLKHVYQIIGEEPEWITYKIWKGFIPEAPTGFTQSIGRTSDFDVAGHFERVLHTHLRM